MNLEKKDKSELESWKSFESLAEYSDLRILESFDEPFYVIDMSDCKMLFMNSAAKKAFGVNDFNGKYCYQVFHGLKERCSVCDEEELLKKGRSVYSRLYNNGAKKTFRFEEQCISFKGKAARLGLAIDLSELEDQTNELKIALKSEDVLKTCIGLLYSAKDLDETLIYVLKILGEYFEAEKAHIFEFRDGLTRETHEWVAQGKSPKKEFLQNVESGVFPRWREIFSRRETVMVSNVEDLAITDPFEYEFMKSLGFSTYVNAPIEYSGIVAKFIGLDNLSPSKIKNAAGLLQTLSYFISLAMQIDENKRFLQKLSYSDEMTGVSNRNALIRDLQKYKNIDKETYNQSVGVAFMDLNGLKSINDIKGHKEGDNVIIGFAHAISAYFGSTEIYRVGGDEFIVICFGISSAQFETKIGGLERFVSENPEISVSIGKVWSDKTINVQSLIAEADKDMYREKQQYYNSSCPTKPRSKNISEIVDVIGKIDKK